MIKNDLIAVMQIAISLLDKGEANKANGVLKIALTQEFSSAKQLVGISLVTIFR